jgi:hypothetical protein
MRTVASADPGVLEVTMRRDGDAEQLFPSMAIARRMLIALFAIIGLRRSIGKAREALEIAHVAQCALQSFRRPVQVMEFTPPPQRDGFGQRFQHVAEAFGLDPQPVTT